MAINTGKARDNRMWLRWVRSGSVDILIPGDSTQRFNRAMEIARTSDSLVKLMVIARKAMRVELRDPSTVLSAIGGNPNLTEEMICEIDGFSNHAFKFRDHYCPVIAKGKMTTGRT